MAEDGDDGNQSGAARRYFGGGVADYGALDGSEDDAVCPCRIFRNAVASASALKLSVK